MAFIAHNPAGYVDYLWLLAWTQSKQPHKQNKIKKVTVLSLRCSFFKCVSPDMLLSVWPNYLHLPFRDTIMLQARNDFPLNHLVEN